MGQDVNVHLQLQLLPSHVSLAVIVFYTETCKGNLLAIKCESTNGICWKYTEGILILILILIPILIPILYGLLIKLFSHCNISQCLHLK